MCLKILCLAMIVTGAVSADDFLSQLYGLERQNHMLICLKAVDGKRDRSCSGALLNDEWVGVSAGCLRQHPQEYMVALRLTQGETCDDITHGYSTLRSRGVRAHFYHPWLDLALVLLDRPYLTLDVHPNSTAWTVPRTFRKHGQWTWIKRYMKASALTRDRVHHYKMLVRQMASTRAPFLMFFLAIVLPTVILGLVYVYIIYYANTGIPFKKFKYTKKASQV